MVGGLRPSQPRTDPRSVIDETDAKSAFRIVQVGLHALDCHKVGAISGNGSCKWDFAKCKMDLETPEELKNVALDCHKVGAISGNGSCKWGFTRLIVTRSGIVRMGFHEVQDGLRNAQGARECCA